MIRKLLSFALTVIATTALADNKSFTEADFDWDTKTTPHKQVIIAGVNKAHREDARCTKISPYSAYISSTKGTKVNPVFFVTCGEGLNSVNVFFSKSDVADSNVKLTATKHLSKEEAIEKCQMHAKSKSEHPSTVKRLPISPNVTEYPNGNTRVVSGFTDKNTYNLELKHSFNCLINAAGLLEVVITE